MDKAYSLASTMQWFLEHASGSVLCIKDHKECICESYTDAVEFYKYDRKGRERNAN